MGLQKAYDELTDTPEFSDGLTMGNSQSIYDSQGFEAIEFIGFTTRVNAPNGDRVFDTDIASGGTKSLWYANSNRDVGMYDDQFGGNAVSYNSSASAPGTLELTNADLYKPSVGGETVSYFTGGSSDTSGIRTGITSQTTGSVGTTATEIINPSDVDGLNVQNGGMLMVTGRNGSDFFTDVVVYAGETGGITVIGSETRISPSTRTYGFSAGGQGITLEMGSGDYTVQTVAISGQET